MTPHSSELLREFEAKKILMRLHVPGDRLSAGCAGAGGGARRGEGSGGSYSDRNTAGRHHCQDHGPHARRMPATSRHSLCAIV